jgi:hypothetical protein
VEPLAVIEATKLAAQLGGETAISWCATPPEREDLKDLG